MQREKIVQLQHQDFHSDRLDATWPGSPGPNPRHFAVWAQDTTTDWPWWASRPLRSPNSEEPRSGEMPVYSWTECKQPVGFARTFSATAQQLAHVKKGVNGSKHWHFFKTCWREVYVMISLATTRQSVHARRGGQWQRALTLFQELPEATMNPNVISYNAAISACEKGGQWQQALLLFQIMPEVGSSNQVPPNPLFLGLIFLHFPI